MSQMIWCRFIFELFFFRWPFLKMPRKTGRESENAWVCENFDVLTDFFFKPAFSRSDWCDWCDSCTGSEMFRSPKVCALCGDSFFLRPKNTRYISTDWWMMESRQWSFCTKICLGPSSSHLIHSHNLKHIHQHPIRLRCDMMLSLPVSESLDLHSHSSFFVYWRIWKNHEETHIVC